MIVIRNVFRLKFGKTREAVALMKEGRSVLEQRDLKGVFMMGRVSSVVVASLIAVALSQGPPSGVLQAQKAAQGGGVPVFQVDPTWPQLPNGWKLGVTSSV